MDPQLAVMIAHFLQLVWWVVLIRAVVSWFVHDPSNPLLRLLSTLTDPWMRPLSRHLTFGGIDISPLVVLFLIRIVRDGLLRAAY